MAIKLSGASCAVWCLVWETVKSNDPFPRYTVLGITHTLCPSFLLLLTAHSSDNSTSENPFTYARHTNYPPFHSFFLISCLITYGKQPLSFFIFSEVLVFASATPPSLCSPVPTTSLYFSISSLFLCIFPTFLF